MLPSADFSYTVLFQSRIVDHAFRISILDDETSRDECLLFMGIRIRSLPPKNPWELHNLLLPLIQKLAHSPSAIADEIPTKTQLLLAPQK